jgi:hypothetical protein
MLSIAVVHLFHKAANKASSWTGGRIAWSGSPATLAGEHETFDRLLGVGGLH